jgi:hypothetical protein
MPWMTDEGEPASDPAARIVVWSAAIGFSLVVWAFLAAMAVQVWRYFT